MRARARIAAEAGGRGSTRWTTLASAPPLVVRATGSTAWLVGGAAGPLGGDDLGLSLDVGPGAAVEVRTAAASIVLPGPARSQLSLDVGVGEGGSLRFEPEPVVVARGALHRSEVRIRLAPGSSLRWLDQVVLGRGAEVPGSIEALVRVEVAGRPLLHTELHLGPDAPWSTGPAGTGPARVVATAVLVDPSWAGGAPDVELPDGASVLALDGPGVLVTVLGSGAVDVRSTLDGVVDALVSARLATDVVHSGFTPTRPVVRATAASIRGGAG